MQERVKVSIIVPVYNSELYIADMLEDILKQTYQNYEVIIINDGSPDGSRRIIEEYVRRDARLQLINTQNAGVSQARNIGISKASGEYIRFLDADDRIEPDSLALMLEAACQDTQIDMVIGSFRSIPESNLYYGEHAEAGKKTIEQLAYDFQFNVRSYYYGVVWNKLYKRSIILENNLRFDKEIKWCEDLLFNIEYFRCCRYFYYMPDEYKVYDYIRRESGLSSSINMISKPANQAVEKRRIKATQDFFDELGMPDTIRLEWEYAFLFFELLRMPANPKYATMREKYRKMKALLQRPGVDEYVKRKKEYFSEQPLYGLVFFTIKSDRYLLLFIVAYVYTWLHKNMYWLKSVWDKLGGKRPKVL